MRKVIYSQMVSVDGYMEDQNGSIDWSKPDEEVFQHIIDQEKTFDTHLYGRKTYENMAGHWPYVVDDPESSSQDKEWARMWVDMKKIVFSKTLDKAEWNSKIVKDNLREEIEKEKALPGKNLSLGGATIAQTLMELDVIDEYWLYVHPVTLGGGKPMFHKQLTLQLIEARSFASGIVLLRYRKRGE
ncbi:dihydrofolate reductase [Gracilibacillus salitolerans]|uniref:Dihydrofolate reductase n=1 Tax=Gracilibacillus salitolerans TaxID=2663022 RepID=A0A5Q2TS08_9BACI|nr:dihydrofolate reductase family protein [Gracilibacillus salitolerans]QGH35558.1 dihydrofolate reductase [Gracilibacillus salitolerans]